MPAEERKLSSHIHRWNTFQIHHIRVGGGEDTLVSKKGLSESTRFHICAHISGGHFSLASIVAGCRSNLSLHYYDRNKTFRPVRHTVERALIYPLLLLLSLVSQLKKKNTHTCCGPVTSFAPFMASRKPSQSYNAQKTIARRGCVLDMCTEEVCVCCSRRCWGAKEKHRRAWECNHFLWS